MTGREARPDDPDGPPDEARRVGLCFDCRHARVQRNARGSAFWRCEEALRRPGMLRYPPLPVRTCPAFARRPGGLPSGGSLPGSAGPGPPVEDP